MGKKKHKHSKRLSATPDQQAAALAAMDALDAPPAAPAAAPSTSDSQQEHLIGVGHTLAKKLASSVPRRRTKALRLLKFYLSTRTHISRLDMQKLWKPLFYCFWMSDKPLIQLELAEKLAGLVVRVGTRPVGKEAQERAAHAAQRRAAAARNASSKRRNASTDDDDEDDDGEAATGEGAVIASQRALLYFEMFQEATVREWRGIDRLRMDKFMLFVRRMVNAMLRLCQEHGWSVQLISAWAQLLQQPVIKSVTAGVEVEQAESDPNNANIGRAWPGFLTPNAGVNVGLTLHVVDLIVTELAQVLTRAPRNSDTIALPIDSLRALLAPFCNLVAHTKDPAILTRTIDNVFRELLGLVVRYLQSVQDEAMANELSGGKGDGNARRLDPEDVSRDRLAEAVLVHMEELASDLFDLAADPDTRDKNRRAIYEIQREYAGFVDQLKQMDAAMEDVEEEEEEQSTAAAAAAAAEAAAPQKKKTKKSKKHKRKRKEKSATPAAPAATDAAPRRSPRLRKKAKKGKQARAKAADFF